MRVRFGNLREDERERLAAIDRAVAHWFDEAARNRRELAWWNQRLAQLDPDLYAEQTAPETLAIRALRRDLAPLAERIAAQAPAGFSVCTQRARMGLAEALVQARAGKAWRAATVRAGFARGHLLDVIVQLPGGSASAEELSIAEELVWALVGERLANDWIGSVDVVAGARGGPLRVLSSQPESAAGFAIAELPLAVDAAVKGVYEGLSPQPYWARQLEGEWTLFELEPLADGSLQDDLVLVTTCAPELVRCTLEGAPFSSLRFSRHGELFFVLKYRAAGVTEARLSARAELEDALDRGLVAARAGRVLGGGLGLGHDYVHLALSEPSAALTLVGALGRERNLPRESLLLALDNELAREWVEVWPGADAPIAVSRD